MVNEGIKWCSQGAELDRNERFQEAYKCYVTGTEYLLTGLKYLPSDFEEFKEKLAAKLKEVRTNDL